MVRKEADGCEGDVEKVLGSLPGLKLHNNLLDFLKSQRRTVRIKKGHAYEKLGQPPDPGYVLTEADWSRDGERKLDLLAEYFEACRSEMKSIIESESCGLLPLKGDAEFTGAFGWLGFWQVLYSPLAMRTIVQQGNANRREVLAALTLLASGNWRHVKLLLDGPLPYTQMFQVKLRGTVMVFTVEVHCTPILPPGFGDRSKRYSELSFSQRIVVYGLVKEHRVPAFAQKIARMLCEEGTPLPVSILVEKYSRKDQVLPRTFAQPTLRPDHSEILDASKSLPRRKFFSPMLSDLITHADMLRTVCAGFRMKPPAPMRLSDEERNIIAAEGNVLLLGRSGTGKSTSALLHLWARWAATQAARTGLSPIVPAGVDAATASVDDVVLVTGLDDDDDAADDQSVASSHWSLMSAGGAASAESDWNNDDFDVDLEDDAWSFVSGAPPSSPMAPDSSTPSSIAEGGEPAGVKEDVASATPVDGAAPDGRSTTVRQGPGKGLEWRALFITLSPVLCAQAQRYFAKLQRTLDPDAAESTGKGNAPEGSAEPVSKEDGGESDGDFLEESEDEREGGGRENDDDDDELPPTLAELQGFDPCFLTLRNFLCMLDGTFAVPFFSRDADGVMVGRQMYDVRGGGAALLPPLGGRRNPLNLAVDGDDSASVSVAPSTLDGDKAAALPKGPLARPGVHPPGAQELDFDCFLTRVWPTLSSGGAAGGLHPAVVWTEIMSHIKGSAEALENHPPCLLPEQYDALGHKRVAVASRRTVYELFLKYEAMKTQLSMYDMADFTLHLHSRLHLEGYRGVPIHAVYVDELQDLPQATLSLLFRVCPTPHGLFLAGDTCQTIARGTGFRFCDVRSQFHQRSRAALMSKVYKVPRIHHLSHNYRCHTRLLQLGHSISRLLEELFPYSIDRLPCSTGQEDGPLPMIVPLASKEALVRRLTAPGGARTIAFGAGQVILVRDEKSKELLPETLRGALTMTVVEAKGLEFEDVVLCNFFAHSSASEEDWRVVNSLTPSRVPLFREGDGPNEGEGSGQDVAERMGWDRDDSLVSTLQLDEATGSVMTRAAQFDTQTNALLCSELKHLYTAVTRAKQRLFVFDESPKAAPMFQYWGERGLAVAAQDDELLDDVARPTSAESWRMQGKSLLTQGHYQAAETCFVQCGDAKLLTLAQALGIAAAAEQTAKNSLGLAGKALKEQRKTTATRYREAAALFKTIQRGRHAARCLFAAGDHVEAANMLQTLGRHCEAGVCFEAANMLQEAATEFEAAGRIKDAVRVYERLRDTIQCIRIARLHPKSFTPQGLQRLLERAGERLSNTEQSGRHVSPLELWPQVAPLLAALSPAAAHLRGPEEVTDEVLAALEAVAPRLVLRLLEACGPGLPPAVRDARVLRSVLSVVQRLVHQSSLPLSGNSLASAREAVARLAPAEQGRVLISIGDSLGAIEAFARSGQWQLAGDSLDATGIAIFLPPAKKSKTKEASSGGDDWEEVGSASELQEGIASDLFEAAATGEEVPLASAVGTFPSRLAKLVDAALHASSSSPAALSAFGAAIMREGVRCLLFHPGGRWQTWGDKRVATKRKAAWALFVAAEGIYKGAGDGTGAVTARCMARMACGAPGCLQYLSPGATTAIGTGLPVVTALLAAHRRGVLETSTVSLVRSVETLATVATEAEKAPQAVHYLARAAEELKSAAAQAAEAGTKVTACACEHGAAALAWALSTVTPPTAVAGAFATAAAACATMQEAAGTVSACAAAGEAVAALQEAAAALPTGSKIVAPPRYVATTFARSESAVSEVSEERLLSLDCALQIARSLLLWHTTVSPLPRFGSAAAPAAAANSELGQAAAIIREAIVLVGLRANPRGYASGFSAEPGSFSREKSSKDKDKGGKENFADISGGQALKRCAKLCAQLAARACQQAVQGQHPTVEGTSALVVKIHAVHRAVVSLSECFPSKDIEEQRLETDRSLQVACRALGLAAFRLNTPSFAFAAQVRAAMLHCVCRSLLKETMDITPATIIPASLMLGAINAPVVLRERVVFLRGRRSMHTERLVSDALAYAQVGMYDRAVGCIRDYQAQIDTYEHFPVSDAAHLLAPIVADCLSLLLHPPHTSLLLHASLRHRRFAATAGRPRGFVRVAGAAVLDALDLMAGWIERAEQREDHSDLDTVCSLATATLYSLERTVLHGTVTTDPLYDQIAQSIENLGYSFDYWSAEWVECEVVRPELAGAPATAGSALVLQRMWRLVRQRRQADQEYKEDALVGATRSWAAIRIGKWSRGWLRRTLAARHQRQSQAVEHAPAEVAAATAYFNLQPAAASPLMDILEAERLVLRFVSANRYRPLGVSSLAAADNVSRRLLAAFRLLPVLPPLPFATIAGVGAGEGGAGAGAGVREDVVAAAAQGRREATKLHLEEVDNVVGAPVAAPVQTGAELQELRAAKERRKEKRRVGQERLLEKKALRAFFDRR